ncbi:MAG: YbhB/YbcL family Raf kinase inhibitor-like protein [Thermoplasmata archaeon]|nr:YbhB/YbcL family Raf kinase inhibitor-like protein [Thermoplasmata archaeon]
MVLTLSTSAWGPGGAIPKRYSGDGDEVSPPLEILGTPLGTRALALICTDPDAPLWTFVHWVLYDIPPTTTSIPEAIPKGQPTLADGSKQGANGMGRIGYLGPQPPRGVHRYVFRIYALSQPLSLPPGVKAKRLEKAMEGRIVETSELVGTYSRG